MSDSRVIVGVIGRPHGVRGLVHVHVYAADPANLERYGTLTDDAGRQWTLRWRNEGVAELRGADGTVLPDRSAAERLVNQHLWTARDQLPPPEDDEFYLADLVGLAARDPAGEAIGQVAIVHDYGAGASLEIVRPGASPLLVPFTRAAVPVVDIVGGHVVVDNPAVLDADPAKAAG